jgi:hypothetical protein
MGAVLFSARIARVLGIRTLKLESFLTECSLSA